MAVDATRSGRDLRYRQSARFHTARYSAGQAGLDDEDRGRQTGHADADHERADEVHHYQSELECAGLDRRKRISAFAAAGPDDIATDGVASQLQRGWYHSPFPATG